MAQLLSNWQEFKLPKRGDEVEGVVVQILPDKILVDFGGKSEGEITGHEFENLKNLGMLPAIGEKITAVVTIPEDEKGTTFLSIGSKLSDSTWDKLEKAASGAENFEAEITGLAKSGILVEIVSLRGFIPASFVRTEILANFAHFRGKKIEVKPIEVNKASNRLICRQVFSKTQETQIASITKKYKKGNEYQGSIAATLPFGAVIKFNSWLGFVPNSELAWEKVEDAGNLFKVGQNINFVFLGADETTGNPQISVKATIPDPFEKIAQNYPKGGQIRGVVSRITDFGVFVTLPEGVEGLIHISKIPPEMTLIPGQQVTCSLDSVDAVQRRVSLSLVLTTKPVGYR